MKRRVLRFRSCLFVIAVVWQNSNAQAQSGTEFLSTLESVEVPAPVPRVSTTGTKSSSSASNMSVGLTPESKQDTNRTTLALQRNRRLKAPIALQVHKTYEQETVEYGVEHEKHTETLNTQKELIHNQIKALTTQQDILKNEMEEQKANKRNATDVAKTKEDNFNEQLKMLKKVQTTLSIQLAESKRQNEMLVQQVSAITKQRDTLQQHQAKSEQSVTAFSRLMEILKMGSVRPIYSLEKNIASLQKQLSDVQKKNTVLKEEGEAAKVQVFTLKEEVKTLTQNISGFQAQLVNTPPNLVRKTSSLTTDIQRQTYASGVVFADTLKRTLALQKTLGITADSSLLLAGLTDAMHDSVRLNERDLSTSYRALIMNLSALEDKKYREGIKVLEKLSSGPSLLKRNRTVFFVQGHKGTEVMRPGDTLNFDMIESVVKGKVLRETKGIKTKLDDKLPYIVAQALTLAGRGGSITVYCMASDIYPPEQLPIGLFPFSLLKYNFSVWGK